jgi:hypothetical protein
LARQTALKFSGTTGGVIFYERLGGYYMRSKPQQVRQTTATKASAGTFGKANTLGKSLRQAMKPILPNAADRQLMYRLSNALQRWLTVKDDTATGLKPVAPLQYFELNTACSLKERCKPGLTVQWQPDGTALLNIPAINPVADITAPAGTIAVQMHIMAVACRVNDASIASVQEQTIAYNYTATYYPSQQVSFSLPVSNGNLLLIAVALRYCLQGMPERYDNRIQWLPAAVVGAAGS